MKVKILFILITIITSSTIYAGTDLIFKSTFEQPVIPTFKLNDTGITWSGEYPSGNNVDCTSTTTSSQDCNTGRDVTDNDPTDGHAGFSFTKLDASGTPLADQSVDYVTTPWACVKDNVTGLVWEVKTTTAGIHNQDNAYKWGGLTAIGYDSPVRRGIYNVPSWNEVVQGSNSEVLCGFDNWRMPTILELASIANKGKFNPSIDVNYFPNTISSWYWTSAPLADLDYAGWYVRFDNARSSFWTRDHEFHVRLVSSE